MLRVPILRGPIRKKSQIRMKSSSYIRSTYIDYFVNQHGHKNIKSSSVVPFCDRTVPFVNAGMNQFKGVFLGLVEPPCQRAVNSQKCVRVGGKHNDLDLVGIDGHHHTFFEMLGNWSFGDYYKKEACQMAWDLLLGPYRLKPENLLVTYFSGDAVIDLQEDRECRDIWKKIGVPESRLIGHGARDNFWEMGPSGPCGPCTEIHYVHSDGTLTEIWNLVFIQYNREREGALARLRRRHVDGGLGLERLVALLQGRRDHYDTDLFTPLVAAAERNSRVPPYGGRFGPDALLDVSYRRLVDHARLLAVCLADGALPATNLNVKQIMRKSFKMSTDVFQNPNLLTILYDEVIATLGDTYPELIAKEKDAKLILEHERESYATLRIDLAKKWKDLAKIYPEVEALSDVELSGFVLGYKEFKETMSKTNSSIIPGEVVFKLYDTHGFQEDIIERIAKLNNLEIDRKEFWKLLSNHKSRHKTAFKEQTSKNGIQFDKAIEKLKETGVQHTDDQAKYDYIYTDNRVTFKPLVTKLVGILNEESEWLDFSEPCKNRPYYLITERTNFYCEEGGQVADDGVIHVKENIDFKVDSVFKIRGIVFHKGTFILNNKDDSLYISTGSDVRLAINTERRLNIMRNHTGVHLLNAAIRKALPDSVISQIGSSVTEGGLSLSLSIYGEKLSQKVILEAQELIRSSISSSAPVSTRTLSSACVSSEEGVVLVPGETYPHTGLRLVSCPAPLPTKELCCGTHAPATGELRALLVTRVRGVASRTPTIHALTGPRALQVSELFCRAQKLSEVIELADPERVEEEIGSIKRQLRALCGPGGGAGGPGAGAGGAGAGAGGPGGAPAGLHAACLQLLDGLNKRAGKNDTALIDLARAEIEEACSEAVLSGRRFAVHFLRCSYLMRHEAVRSALAEERGPGALGATKDLGAPGASEGPGASEDPGALEGPGGELGDLRGGPVLLLGCAGGVVVATAKVPQEMVTSSFTAERWLSCILPIFDATVLPPAKQLSTLTYAEMSATKVSLINCEQMVQDAMRVAIKYAQAHVKQHHTDERSTNIQQN